MRSIIASMMGALLLVPVPTPPGLTGQELPVRSAPSPTPTAGCPQEQPAAEGSDDRASPEDARALARGATEAALLGEPEQALDLLRRATERDPGSADLAYRRARAHDELGQTESAIRWYCRHLALAPDGEDDPEVRSRLADLRGTVDRGPAGPALRQLREGIEHMEQGSLEAAERRFTEALRAEPGLAEALYNRGLARGAAGRAEPAARDLRSYLEARPDAPDRERVAGAIEFLEDPPERFDPTQAMLLGAVLPGAGHFYTGEPLAGSVLLGVAAAAGLTGLLYERVEITCRAPPRDGVCPDDQVHERTSGRPALVPGLLTVAMTAGVSAVMARLRATSENEKGVRLRISGPEEEAVTSARSGIRVLAPAAAATPRGMALEIVRLRF